jgi:hypothetical protein
MKYNEKEILSDIEEFIKTTYNSHYVNGNDIQVNDLLMSIGHAEGGFISNAIEYLARYGKKEGYNVKDLYKAIHNIILLINLKHKLENQNPKDIQLLLEFSDNGFRR